jgi:hypothetical protein
VAVFASHHCLCKNVKKKKKKKAEFVAWKPKISINHEGKGIF